MKRRLYVLTHCESCYNRRGWFTGRVDSVLTDTGHKHAQALARKLKEADIGIAYTSSLTRAKQTLQHILEYHPETKWQVDDRIIERDYGTLSRKSKAKYALDRPDLYPLYHRSYDIAPPGGESMVEVEKRVLAFIRDLLEQMRLKKANGLIVCHGNSIRPIRRYFESLSVDQMMRLEHQRHQIFTYIIEV